MTIFGSKVLNDKFILRVATTDEGVWRFSLVENKKFGKTVHTQFNDALRQEIEKLLQDFGEIMIHNLDV